MYEILTIILTSSTISTIIGITISFYLNKKQNIFHKTLEFNEEIFNTYTILYKCKLNLDFRLLDVGNMNIGTGEPVSDIEIFKENFEKYLLPNIKKIYFIYLLMK